LNQTTNMSQKKTFKRSSNFENKGKNVEKWLDQSYSAHKSNAQELNSQFDSRDNTMRAKLMPKMLLFRKYLYKMLNSCTNETFLSKLLIPI
jgi:hypothetical protein